MKNIILATAVLVSSFGVYADDYCETISTLAELTMTVRQMGLPASETYKTFSDNSEAERRLFLEMIKEAYARPAWASEEAQRKEISEFSSGWFLACIETMGPTQ